jgi:hypothetical protein
MTRSGLGIADALHRPCDRLVARPGRPLASCGRLARDAFGAVRRRDLAVFDLVAARIRRLLPRRAAAVAVMIGR